MEPIVGTDLRGILKTVKGACEGALDDLAKYREGRDPSHLADAAEYLEEIDEFIGGYKLRLMIDGLKAAAKREPNRPLKP